MARWIFLFVFCVSARALVAVDIPLPATMSRLDSLNFVLPMTNGDLSADLHFGYDAKGRIVCSGECNVVLPRLRCELDTDRQSVREQPDASCTTLSDDVVRQSLVWQRRHHPCEELGLLLHGCQP